MFINLAHLYDRVKCGSDLSTNHGSIPEGCLGTVVEASPGLSYIGVEWDEDVGGHSLNGLCCYGYGWRFSSATAKYLEVIEDKPFEEDNVEMSKYLESL